MSRRIFTFGKPFMILSVILIAALSEAYANPAYPPSEIIVGIQFNMSTLRNEAPGNGATAGGSDNWTITWADDGNQYTSFGDGTGFGTFDNTRASLGVARIEGGKSNYAAFDVFKTGADSPGWGGKSRGIAAIGGALWLWREGTGSTSGSFDQTELYKSTDYGASWTFTGVRWDSNDFGSNAFYAPTFLQFGQDYADARDSYVYVYVNESSGDGWEVQIPGGISLFRVPKDSLEDKSAYEYFVAADGDGNPQWSTEVMDRRPVFQDPVNGNMRTSVSYNRGLGRYVLTTQQVSRQEAGNYHIGIYDAPEPWGPWTTVLFGNAKAVGPNLNIGSKTVYWNFSNKWLSVDGKDFVMVYTGDGADEWGTVEGSFLTNSDTPVRPNAPDNLQVE